MRIDESGGVSVARLTGELEMSTVGRAREQLLRAVDNRQQGLILDLSAVSYLDSAGINFLFEVSERLAERQLRFAVVSPEDSLVDHALTLVKFASAAGVHPTEAAALAEMRAGVQDPQEE